MLIDPLPGTLIVEKQHQGETTEGGIVLPEKVRTDLPFGKVLAFGKPPPKYAEFKIEVGSVVFFSDFAGKELEFDKKKAVSLEYEDLIGVLREETENEPGRS